MNPADFQVNKHFIEVMATQIREYGRKVLMVNVFPDDIESDRQFIETLERKGCEVTITALSQNQQTYSLYDSMVIIRPTIGYPSMEHCTLFVVPTLPDFEKLMGRQDSNFDPYIGYGDVFQWMSNRFVQVESPHRIAKPSMLIGQDSDGQVQMDIEKYYHDTVLALHPELIKYWHRICFVYAGANTEWSIDGVRFNDLVEFIQAEFANGKDKVFFVNSDEAVQPPSVLKCHRLIRYFEDCDPDTWFYVTGSINGEETYKNFCEFIGEVPRCNIISGYRFENVVKSTVETNTMDGELQTSGDELRAIPTHPRVKPKKFVCFNRMTRWHRVQILSYCLANDLVDDAFYSFDISTVDTGYDRKELWDLSNKSRFDGGFLNTWLTRWPWADAIYNNWERFPLELNRTEERENPVELCTDDIVYHTDSYFSVVCETTFHKSLGAEGTPTSMSHTDGVFVSEKVYKPIAYKHPFIVASTPGYLAQMRAIGYKTFHPFIDESYDEIDDDYDRMLAICNQIGKLCALSDHDMCIFLRNIRPIVEHNLEIFLDNTKTLATTKINLEEKFK